MVVESRKNLGQWCKCPWLLTQATWKKHRSGEFGFKDPSPSAFDKHSLAAVRTSASQSPKRLTTLATTWPITDPGGFLFWKRWPSGETRKFTRKRTSQKIPKGWENEGGGLGVEKKSEQNQFERNWNHPFQTILGVLNLSYSLKFSKQKKWSFTSGSPSLNMIFLLKQRDLVGPGGNLVSG